MAVTIDELITDILTDIHLPTDGSGLITQETIARFIKESQIEFNDLTLILKTETNIQAIADQIEYDLPDNFKTNLSRVEFDFLALRKENKDFLDLFDRSWRDPDEQESVASIPQYFANHLVKEGKFLIFPPPETTGDSVDLIDDGGGLPISIILGGETITLIDEEGGLLTEITVENEIISLIGLSGGLPLTITIAEGNFTIEYIKKPETFSLSGDMEVQLEPYQEAIKAYSKYKCYLMDIYFNKERAFVHKDIFNEQVLVAKRNIERARPKHPKGMRPIFTRAGLGPKEVFITA